MKGFLFVGITHQGLRTVILWNASTKGSQVSKTGTFANTFANTFAGCFSESMREVSLYEGKAFICKLQHLFLQRVQALA